MKDKGAPLVSAAMGVKYESSDISALKRSVFSILEQTFGNFEFLICEKKSSAEAKNFLREAALNDGRIILLDGSGCNHLGGQLNLCIEAAKGKYIARMDDDDFSHPDRFEEQLSYLEKNEDIAFAGCCVRLIQDGEVIGKRMLPSRPEAKDFLFVQPFIHPSIIFRKEIFTAVGKYSDDKSRRGCEDYDFLMRAYEKGFRGGNMSSLLLDYTVPGKGSGRIKFGTRVNEVKTRFKMFSGLRLMPKAFPYALKPFAVWAVPEPLLDKLRKKRADKAEIQQSRSEDA